MRNDASIKRLYANRIFLVGVGRVSHVRLCAYVAVEQAMNSPATPSTNKWICRFSQLIEWSFFLASKFARPRKIRQRSRGNINSSFARNDVWSPRERTKFPRNCKLNPANFRMFSFVVFHRTVIVPLKPLSVRLKILRLSDFWFFNVKPVCFFLILISTNALLIVNIDK